VLPPQLRVAGVTRPGVIYEAVLMREDGDYIVYQAGGFPTEAEAQKVLDVWTAESRREPMHINVVPPYGSAEEWQANR
jgi:hypothetical protein